MNGHLQGMLDLENPDLFKWLTGQEQPPQDLESNLAFQVDINQLDMNQAAAITRDFDKPFFLDVHFEIWLICSFGPKISPQEARSLSCHKLQRKQAFLPTLLVSQDISLLVGSEKGYRKSTEKYWRFTCKDTAWPRMAQRLG